MFRGRGGEQKQKESEKIAPCAVIIVFVYCDVPLLKFSLRFKGLSRGNKRLRFIDNYELQITNDESRMMNHESLYIIRHFILHLSKIQQARYKDEENHGKRNIHHIARSFTAEYRPTKTLNYTCHRI